MKFVFTKHAINRLYDRNLNKETAIYCIKNADFKKIRFGNEIEATKQINNQRLKVVYIQTKNIIKIITIYWIG